MRFIKRPSQGIDVTQAKNSRTCSEFSREDHIDLMLIIFTNKARLIALEDLLHSS